MSINAYKVEAIGHDRTGKDFGYVNKEGEAVQILDAELA